MLANDRDPDDDDTLTYVSYDGTGVTRGVLKSNGDGTFNFDPNAEFNSLGVGADYSQSFTYTIKDSHGAVSTARVTITVTGVNDPPTANDDSGPDFTTSEDTAFTANVFANDTDPDNGDTQTLVSYDASGVTKGVLTYEGNGEFRYDPHGDFDYMSAGDEETQSFAYTMKDGSGSESSATVMLTITGVNDPPVAGVFSSTGNEESVIVIDGWNFTDAEGDDASHIGVSVLSGDGTLFIDTDDDNMVGAGEVVKVFDAGDNTTWITWEDATVNGKVKFAPNTDWNGTTTVAYRVRDVIGDWGPTADATIEVTAIHDEPVARDFTEIVPEDNVATINDWICDDSKDDVGESSADSPASVTIQDLPSHGTLYYGSNEINIGDEIPWASIIDDVNGNKVTFVPDPDWNGQTTFHYTVRDDGTDHNQGTAAGEVTIDVAAVHDEPVGHDFTESGTEDTVVTINDWIFDDTKDDVGESSADSPASVTIQDLPSHGTLYFGSNEINIGDEIPWASAIDAVNGNQGHVCPRSGLERANNLPLHGE